MHLLYSDKFNKSHLTILFLLFSFCSLAQSKQESGITISANADIYSRYIWRGSALSSGPVFQPGLSASYKDFTLGYYGSYKIAGTGDNEINLFISKSFGPLTLEIWDYWSYDNFNIREIKNYNRATTSHLLEGIVTLSAGEFAPLSLSAGWLFYGTDATNSIYLELQYAIPVKRSEVVFTAGYQANGTYYSDRRGFVNLSATYNQPLAVSEKVSLDLILSLTANPAEKRVFFTAGISIYNN